MKPVMTYRGENCNNCIKCVKSCPTDAISIIKGKVVIDEHKCIHCHVCVQTCDQKLLKIRQVDLEEAFSKHQYNIALIPTSILSDFEYFDELKDFIHAIKEFRFDEVVQYSDIEGALYLQALKDCQESSQVMLTSFCPIVNRYIKLEYPTLIDHLLPYEYPVEIAAKKIREKYNDKDIGIFSLCECTGKLTLAKEPLGNEESHIDYALSISRMFPHFNKRKGEGKENLEINRYGAMSNVGHLYGQDHLSVMSVEGLMQIKNALELIEFDQLKNVKLLALYHCYQGCIGGYYLWSNPFEGRIHIESMLNNCVGQLACLNKEDYYKEHHSDMEVQTFQQRMAWFQKVNSILETLPQYDCGSCGFASCRGLASRIASGEADDSLCRVKKR